eukprot:1160884-Pelagomonas_calceolata.AAC.4
MAGARSMAPILASTTIHLSTSLPAGLESSSELAQRVPPVPQPNHQCPGNSGFGLSRESH